METGLVRAYEALVRKEARQQAVFLAVYCILITCLVLLASLDDPSWFIFGVLSAATLMVPVMIGVGAFAGDSSEGSDSFMAQMPVSSLHVAAVKIGFGLCQIAGLWLALLFALMVWQGAGAIADLETGEAGYLGAFVGLSMQMCVSSALCFLVVRRGLASVFVAVPFGLVLLGAPWFAGGPPDKGFEVRLSMSFIIGLSTVAASVWLFVRGRGHLPFQAGRIAVAAAWTLILAFITARAFGFMR